MKRLWAFRNTLGVLLAGFLYTAPGLAQSEGGWPTAGWKHSTPADQGVDVTVLDALDRELASGKHGYVDGMLVVRNGYLVYEKSYSHDYQALFEGKDPKRWQYNYYDPDWHPYYKSGPLHTMQSVSKSVTSALVGIAIRRGEIPGTDVEASRYFDGFESTDGDPRWRAMKLRDLLTMTSGIAWDESTVPYTDPGNDCAVMEASEDWIRYVLGRPMATTPGERFVYNSGVTVMLAHILFKATGKHADEYAVEHLFGPLGIESFYWKKTPTGLVDTEGGLYLTARDLAKFGYLYLHDGVWEDKRILPEGWVASTTTPAVDVSESNDRKYGFQWWLLPYDTGSYAYTCLGYGGQILLVLPEHDLLAVFTGWNIYDKPSLSAAFALERILEAVRE
ncbi:MAG TPA: serine hydrolase [Vicinamibacteria bacterium]|nr:serine hydrolase [Vicinamibacteria bacterium]